MPTDPQSKPITMYSASGKTIQVTGKGAYDAAVTKGWSRTPPTGGAGAGASGGGGGAEQASTPAQAKPQSWLDGGGAPNRFVNSMLQGANPFRQPEHPETLKSHGAVADTAADAFNVRETASKITNKDYAGAAGMQTGTWLGAHGASALLDKAGTMAAKSKIGTLALKSAKAASNRAMTTASALGSGVSSQMAYAGEKLIQPIYEAMNKRFDPLHKALSKSIITLTPSAEQLIRGIHELEPEVREHIGGLIRDAGEEVRKVTSTADESATRAAKNKSAELTKTKKVGPGAKQVTKAGEKEVSSTASKESERVSTTEKEKKYNVRSALDYEEAKNLLSHIKSVVASRGMGPQSRLGKLGEEIDKGIDAEAKKVGMDGMRRDSLALWGEMTALRDVAIREMRERSKLKQVVTTVSSRAGHLFEKESKEIPREFVEEAEKLLSKVQGTPFVKSHPGLGKALHGTSVGAKTIPPISRALISMFSGQSDKGSI